MDKMCVGVDIAKASFVVAIKIEDEYKVRSFSNDTEGFSVLLEWIETHSYDTCHFCMEATGKYGDALALFLYSQDFIVSVVNPAKIKYFMRSQLSRNKTDAVDARFICHYCELLTPGAWQPLPLEQQELQALVKRLDTVNKLILQDKNRLDNVEDIIKTSIDEHINYLENESKRLAKQIDKYINDNAELKAKSTLLRSIPGIGARTSSKTLVFLNNITQFDNAKKVAAYIGLNPQHAQSGTSLNYSHISKTGDPKLRKMFFMPALVAIQHEPSIKAFYNKLVSKGKAKKVAICAVMRKLVHIIYGVLKSGLPFDAELICPR